MVKPTGRLYSLSMLYGPSSLVDCHEVGLRWLNTLNTFTPSLSLLSSHAGEYVRPRSNLCVQPKVSLPGVYDSPKQVW